jgi:glycosyltransferase involved in cell wall biosynthesis
LPKHKENNMGQGETKATDIRVSVVIPAHNAAGSIAQCLRSVRQAMPDNLETEIIVVDHGSTDETAKIAAEEGGRVVYADPKRVLGPGGARNFGAQASQGNLLAFLDADVVLPGQWLTIGLAQFRNGFQGVLGFPFVAPEGAGWVGRVWSARSCIDKEGICNVDLLSGCNLLLNRSVFEKVHGFRSELITAQDKDFSMRIQEAGYGVLLMPQPPVIHLDYEKSLLHFAWKEYRRQLYTLHLARIHHFNLRSLRNPLLSAFHVSCMAAVLACAVTARLPLLAVACGLWIFPSLWFCVRRRRARLGPADTLRLLFLYWIRWNAAGCALLAQALRWFRNLFKRG